MDSRAERLMQEVLSLPTRERAELTHRLIESLDPPEVDDPTSTAHDEALRRLDEIDRGAVEPISGDELFRRVRQRLGT